MVLSESELAEAYEDFEANKLSQTVTVLLNVLSGVKAGEPVRKLLRRSEDGRYSCFLEPSLARDFTVDYQCNGRDQVLRFGRGFGRFTEWGYYVNEANWEEIREGLANLIWGAEMMVCGKIKPADNARQKFIKETDESGIRSIAETVRAQFMLNYL